ncbi:hypothetical protein [Haloarcula marina]|uniref:hypothetical protein n=1 Tax=Haloarcula marina TaxID=2961574 RepID=UPI0020B8D345|nr:hypothetical protein [Halomicroarcula marina]
MSSTTVETASPTMSSTRTWSSAVAGGLVAGIGMGLIMHFVMNAMPLVGGLYGQPTVAMGWIAHLVHSVVFALVFAAIVTRTSLREYGLLGMIGLGAAYGIVLELVAAGVVLPIWANAVGLGPLPVPFIVPIGFVTHLVYGILLGAVFGYVLSRDRSRSAMTEPREQGSN